MALLDRQLDRHYTLLVNPQLPETDVILPMVLVGPPGVLLLYTTNERGVFQARGDEWGTLSGNDFIAAKVNLLGRAARMAQALGKFLATQGFAIPVEPVLVCMNPGMHVDSMRPSIRVVMSDGLERFAITLSQAALMLSAESVAAIGDRILKPRGLRPSATGQALAANEPSAASPEAAASQGVSDAPEADAGEPGAKPPKAAAMASAVRPAPTSAGGAASRKGGVRFSTGQWLALGCLFVVFVLILSTIIILAVMNA
jgi:hypothetical protein